jgi:hypothetical protein
MARYAWFDPVGNFLAKVGVSYAVAIFDLNEALASLFGRLG